MHNISPFHLKQQERNNFARFSGKGILQERTVGPDSGIAAKISNSRHCASPMRIKTLGAILASVAEKKKKKKTEKCEDEVKESSEPCPLWGHSQQVTECARTEQESKTTHRFLTKLQPSETSHPSQCFSHNYSANYEGLHWIFRKSLPKWGHKWH